MKTQRKTCADLFLFSDDGHDHNHDYTKNKDDDDDDGDDNNNMMMNTNTHSQAIHFYRVHRVPFSADFPRPSIRMIYLNLNRVAAILVTVVVRAKFYVCFCEKQIVWCGYSSLPGLCSLRSFNNSVLFSLVQFNSVYFRYESSVIYAVNYVNTNSLFFVFRPLNWVVVVFFGNSKGKLLCELNEITIEYLDKSRDCSLSIGNDVAFIIICIRQVNVVCFSLGCCCSPTRQNWLKCKEKN